MAMIAAVPACAGLCRFVRGYFVGASAANPNLWVFCGERTGRSWRVSRASGARPGGRTRTPDERTDRSRRRPYGQVPGSWPGCRTPMQLRIIRGIPGQLPVMKQEAWPGEEGILVMRFLRQPDAGRDRQPARHLPDARVRAAHPGARAPAKPANGSRDARSRPAGCHALGASLPTKRKRAMR
jgi:hypothetical protein